MSTLSEYIKSQPEKPMREWAEILEISRPHLLALLDGSRSPSLGVAQRIETQTNGAVPVSAWPNFAAIARALHGGNAA